MFECKRNRSKFWLRIHENDDHINISASRTAQALIQRVFPHFEMDSPRGWCQSRNYPDMYNLKLPDDCFSWQDLDDLKLWAKEANKLIWLNTNKHTEPYFIGSELDFAVAFDWNFDFSSNERTPVGYAEYLLKYRAKYLSEDRRREQVGKMARAVQRCVSALPIDVNEYVVTTIPATAEDQMKLSWKLARFIARSNGMPFVGVTLSRAKPQMKTLPLPEKIRTWREIYADNDWVIVPSEICGKNVLIVDDLFQSGASILCFAEFLKNSLGVQEVMAVTSVKAQKDGDNT